MGLSACGAPGAATRVESQPKRDSHATGGEASSARPDTQPPAASQAGAEPEKAAVKTDDAPISPQASAEPVAPVLDAELPKGTTVLHVGDSMAEALGKDLQHELAVRGVPSRLNAKAATFIPQWASGVDSLGFRSAITQYHPDLVIITLGGNELAMPTPSQRIAPIREMVKAVGDRPCLWLAPPLWPKAPNTGLIAIIKDNCAPCVFVDTNAMLKLEVLTMDGIHPTLPERKRWALFMIRWLKHNRDPKGPKPWSFLANTTPPPNE